MNYRKAMERKLGRPFDDELQALPATYAWAMSQPIEVLLRAVERLFNSPLLAVGAGAPFSMKLASKRD